MPQTKKKRTTKHRGNAAGVVEARGRTGRKLQPDEKKKATKQTSQQRRAARFEKPPTWKGSLQRAGAAAAIFFGATVLILHQKIVPAVTLAVIMLFVYVPLSFYTDQLLYKRFQRKKLAAKSASKVK